MSAVANASKPSVGLGKIDTSFANRLRSDSNDDAPPSVIHAPVGFRQFVGDPLDAQKTQNFLRPQDNKRSPPQSSSQVRNRSASAPSDNSTVTETATVSPQTPENTASAEDKVGIPSDAQQLPLLTFAAGFQRIHHTLEYSSTPGPPWSRLHAARLHQRGGGRGTEKEAAQH